MTADITCREVVETVSDYVDTALAPVERLRVEQHLLLCGGCSSYVEQMRLAVRVTRSLGRRELGLERRDELLRRLGDEGRGTT